ncbi:probable glycosyltransferase At5g25310 isoform X2 [Phalaenopsis equestris]|uniref:probable glycosyltransferase At5g25310 isoform X2 n=1 Tax=Phalaenopsis equestris TaxID=78828 RepID=UPI0009E2FCA5|nr:probable glycosyltransferase At5g25310 isoform X2 [Phalaenopsis equestris]
MEGCILQFQRLCQNRSRKLISVLALMFSFLLVLHTFTLPSRRTYSTQYPTPKLPANTKLNSLNKNFSSQSQGVGKLSHLSDSYSSIKSLNLSKRPDHDLRVSEVDEKLKNDGSDDSSWLDGDENPVMRFSDDLGDVTGIKKVGDSVYEFLSISDRNRKENPLLDIEQRRIPANELMKGELSVNSSKNAIISVPIASLTEITKAEMVTSLSQQVKQELSNVLTKLNASMSYADTLNEKNALIMSPLTLSEMNSLLCKNRVLHHSMRPRWSSAPDKQILAAQKEIENALNVENDRSYKLMEKTLKIYIYEEGEKPIFHQPLLKGIYAAEGWFMKLMESSKHYIVKDPSQAHLFYMPFSSRLLQLALYVPGSHNRTNMRLHLKNYLRKITVKYPFWNRTGGADHFFVACHDWALNETNTIMNRSIRALCVADLGQGFKLGRDVCLPESKIRLPKNPLKDIGGRPWNQRPVLAFFAGNLHGILRSILLENWESKDPDMKVFGPSTLSGARSKMDYVQYMKSSKYCICPRGYEVNSPRLVESIFFECVPVILADNYVPPFFEILKWEKFSVVVPEKDVPRLKEILVAITMSEYRELQMGVKRVQRHFLWRNKPVKYDLFHMMLHSIWLSRVYNIEVR